MIHIEIICMFAWYSITTFDYFKKEEEKRYQHQLVLIPFSRHKKHIR